MMNFTDHPPDAWSVFDFNNLRNFVKSKRIQSAFLINRSTYLALNLLDFYCCHFKKLINR